MNYDDDYLGVNNPIHPANETEVNAEVVKTWNNLTEAYESGYEDVFFDKLKEIQDEFKDLLYALESVESGLCGKVRSLMQKTQ